MRRFFRMIVILGGVVVVAVAGYLAWEVSQKGVPGEITESGKNIGTGDAEGTPEVGATTESMEEVEQN